MSTSNNQKKQEINTFLFLTVFLAPILAVAIVGGYGLLIWLYQMFAGPPGL
ncbi:MAG: periplasmic nitrate reductase, NapE protein [Gammaproteobacteria bacterium]|jgi:nitrate reductase NapE|nr:periplasmic nitrate reductase, NapE protein [Gammaproteobacteria bacterium]